MKSEMIKYFFEGLGLLLLGIYFVWFTKKYPTEGKDIWLLDAKGYIGGGTCILLGSFLLLNAIPHLWYELFH